MSEQYIFNLLLVQIHSALNLYENKHFDKHFDMPNVTERLSDFVFGNFHV